MMRSTLVGSAIGVAFTIAVTASSQGQSSGPGLPAVAAAGSSTASAAGTTPTYTRDIAPILNRNCVTCHRPGEVAPMSLLSYQDVRPWVAAVRRRVEAREMPPYSLDPSQSLEIQNIRLLSDEEIKTIGDWARAGAPKGDDADLPPARTFAEGWSHPDGRPPDYVVEMPTEIDIPATGVMDYQYLYQRSPFAEDRFLEAIEVQAGQRAVTHHIGVLLTTLPPNMRIGPKGFAIDGEGNVANRRLSGPGSPGPTGSVSAIAATTSAIGAYAPESSFHQWPRGTARQLPRNAIWSWVNHYTPNGAATKDRSRLGFWFSREPVRHEIVNLNIGGPLPTNPDKQLRFFANGHEVERPLRQYDERTGFPPIPSGENGYEIRGETTVPEPITIHALSPHMHYRGKDARYIVKWPDGREETILYVPRYDFNWQFSYALAKPLHVPAGSKLIAIGRYDNSSANRLNPAPEKDVEWGLQSWEEMFTLLAEVTIDSQVLTQRTENPSQ